MRITIQSGKASATIDTLGAELKSWKDQTGKEYIWCGDPAHWKGTSPLLFPMIGNLRDGKTIINGTEYEISKHGFVRDKEFQVLEQGADYVVFSYSYTEATLAMYPFRFNLQLKYHLVGSRLILSYDVYNLDDKEMYFHIGAHPAFNCPMEDDEDFEDYILEFPQPETCQSPVYNLSTHQFDEEGRVCHLDHSNTITLDYSKFQSDALVFEDLKSKKVSLIHKDTKKGISVDFHTFDMVAFWTPMNDTAPFLCIEPWNGAAIFSNEDNEFKHKRSIQTLQAGERRSYQLIFDVVK